MKKRLKEILLAGLVISIGLGLVACGENKEGLNELDQAQEDIVEDDHTHDAPYEWRGTYDFEDGEEYIIKFNKNDGDDHMTIGFIRTDAKIDDVEHHAAHMMDKDAVVDRVEKGGSFQAKHEYAYELDLAKEPGEFTFKIDKGEYFIFTEHLPEEFDLEIIDGEGNTLEPKDYKEYDEDFQA